MPNYGLFLKMCHDFVTLRCRNKQLVYMGNRQHKSMKLDPEQLRSDASKMAPVWKGYFKRNKSKLEKMDLEVHRLHDKWSERIDCLSCGNCCRSLGPRLIDKDVERLAKALRMKPAAVVDRYLHIDEDGDLVFKSMPCPFLGADNFCAVYEARPKACREYPHTDRKKFAQIFTLSVTNAETCPIVYEVLSELIPDPAIAKRDRSHESV